MAATRKAEVIIVSGNIGKYRRLKFPGAGGKSRCAKALNITIQQWSLWENGHRLPSERNMLLIAKALDVTTEDLQGTESQESDIADIVKGLITFIKNQALQEIKRTLPEQLFTTPLPSSPIRQERITHIDNMQSINI